MPIRAVLFDLDNTLTDRNESLRVFARRFAVDFAASLAEDQAAEHLETVIHDGDGGGYKPKEGMFAEIQALLRWRDVSPSLDVIRDYWYRVSPECMQFRPGVMATLETLLRHNYRTGLITNGQTVVQNATIDALNLRASLHSIVISEAAGCRKPDARTFHLALEPLQLKPPECLFVGDHPAADVEGARNAGLIPVWLEGCHPAPETMPASTLRIGAIPEILNLLAEGGV
jgi:putative hydrolase of the HAD superfamily